MQDLLQISKAFQAILLQGLRPQMMALLTTLQMETMLLETRATLVMEPERAALP